MGSLASTIGTIGGGLLGGPTGAAIGGALGSAIGGSPDVQSPYNTAAGQYQQNAQLAAFRPVGITTSFGSSNFQIDPTTGQLVSAGYSLNPQLQALQQSLLGNYGNALSQAQGFNTAPISSAASSLFGLGQGYLSASPEEARQRYISQQQGLVAPQNEQVLANLRNRLAQTGRAGLAIGGTMSGNMAQTNPEMAAYYNALANQNRQIAAGADQAAQQQQGFGVDLMNQGIGLFGKVPTLQSAYYSPLQTQLGLGSSIESLGQSPLDIGAQLGGRTATAGQNMASILNQGANLGLQGANAQADVNAARNSSLLSSVGGLFSNPTVANTTKDWFSSILNTNSTASPFYNTGAGVFSPSYMGGTSWGE